MTLPTWLRYAFGAQAGLLVGMGLGRFGYSPMIPPLIQSGSLSAAEAGYVGAMNLASYVVGALSVPLLRRNWHEADVLRTCLFLSLASLVASIIDWGFVWLAFWRVVVGITVAVMMVLGVAYVTHFAPRERAALATSIAFTGVGIGIFFSAAGLPWLLECSLAWGWAGSAVIGTLGVTIGLWAWSGAPRIDGAGFPGGPSAPISSDGKKLVAVQALFSLGLVPHSIYWVDYIVRGLGEPMHSGAFHWTLVGAGALLGTMFWGRFADWIGLTPALVVIFSALAFSLIVPVLAPEPQLILLSSIVFGSQPGLSAVISARAQKTMGNQPMVHLWRWMTISVGAAQLVGGICLVELFNRTGDYQPVFLIGGAAMGLAALLCATLSWR